MQWKLICCAWTHFLAFMEWVVLKRHEQHYLLLHTIFTFTILLYSKIIKIINLLYTFTIFLQCVFRWFLVSIFLIRVFGIIFLCTLRTFFALSPVTIIRYNHCIYSFYF